MKLRNKKTGEIGEPQVTEKYCAVVVGNGTADCNVKLYCTLDKLNEERGDVPEEPKEYWYIDYDGGILCGESDESSAEKMMISMGNHFESLEEAEKAVEKLKAWKRLKDKKFRFRKWRTADIGGDKYYFVIQAEADDADKADLDLLFGGEE